MEELGMEEQMVDATSHIAKGKRTKRLRLLSHSGGAAAVVTSSCSSASGGSLSSTTYESIDEEEEDMANCLILLAQGQRQSHHHMIKKQQQQQGEYHDGDDGNINKTEKGNRRFAEISTTATNNTKVGFYIYECKTCNRTFPSFQALGGHRASHKKPKLIIPEEKKPQPQQPPPPPTSQQQLVVTNYDESDREAGQHRGPTISLQLGSHGHKAIFKANKIHECSVCGSEFTSGQALGGHMRRHRANAATAAVVDGGGVRPRNILQLDLNLPAPEDVDLRESKFQFPVTQKSMVLSAAPALVDCHY